MGGEAVRQWRRRVRREICTDSFCGVDLTDPDTPPEHASCWR